MKSIHQKPTNFKNIYDFPDAMQSLESFERLFNYDLSELDNFSLKQESLKIRLALAFINLQRQPWLFIEPGDYIPASEWLKKRQTAIRKELNKLRGRKYEHKKQA